MNDLPGMLVLPDGGAGVAASAFRIHYAGSGAPGEAWTSDGDVPYRTEHHSMQLVLAGRGALWSEGGWTGFQVGDLLLVPGNCWLRRRGEAGLALRWVGFGVEPIALDHRIGALGRVLRASASEHPAIAAGMAAAAAMSHPAAAARAEAALHLAVAMMLEAAGAAEPPPASAPALRARDFIERHYRACPSLAAVGRAAGLSPNHAHGVFSRAFGCTPMAYALRLRLRDAQALLLGTDLPIGEIARRCGYADPFHFSRVVRRACGMSPSALRAGRYR